MDSNINFLPDTHFLELFESKQLDAAQFNHLGHIRIAWLYLNKYDLELAVDKVCCGISAFAESLGAKQKYNATMTNALVRIIAKRMEGSKDLSWTNFRQQNRDLVEDGLSVLYLHYSEALLAKDASRRVFLAPDLSAF